MEKGRRDVPVKIPYTLLRIQTLPLVYCSWNTSTRSKAKGWNRHGSTVRQDYVLNPACLLTHTRLYNHLSAYLCVCLFVCSPPAQRSSEGQKSELIFSFLCISLCVFVFFLSWILCVCWGAERSCSELSYEVCSRKDGSFSSRGWNSGVGREGAILKDAHSFFCLFRKSRVMEKGKSLILLVCSLSDFSRCTSEQKVRSTPVKMTDCKIYIFFFC